MPRDFYLSPKDVSNIRQGLDEAEWKFDKDEAMSLRLWAQENANNVLVYNERATASNIDISPFQMAVSTNEQIQLAVKYGKNRPFLLDSTFGTNSRKASETGNRLLVYMSSDHA